MVLGVGAGNILLHSPRVAATGIVGAHAQHRTCLFPCPKYKFTAPRSRGFLPKKIYCISRRTQQRNQCPYSTHKPSSNTLLSQGTKRRVWERQGKASQQQKGSVGSVRSPSEWRPLSPPPSLPGDRSLTEGVAWEGAWCNSHPGNEPHAWLFPGTACAALTHPHKGNAVTAERLWERRPPAGLLKSTARGREAPALTKSCRITGALGSGTLSHTVPVPPQERKPHLSSSWLLHGY